MKNKNFDDCSSLKFFKFDGWTSEKIIEKYETVLTSREKQITDLSMEIGSLNDRLASLADNNKAMLDENEMLKNRLQKRENILTQELNNKEIMFMRMERIEQECDELKRRLEKYEAKIPKDQPMRDFNSNFEPQNNFLNNVKSNFFESTSQIATTNLDNNTLPKEETKNENKIIVNSKGSFTTTTSQTPTTKLSALDKIRELKEKKNNPSSSRINLTSSIIESNNVSSNSPSEVKLEEEEKTKTNLEKETPEITPSNSELPHNSTSETKENNIY